MTTTPTWHLFLRERIPVWNKDDEYSYTEWKQLVTPTLALLQYNLEEIENGTASLTLERDQLLLARIVESLVHAKAALAHAKQGTDMSGCDTRRPVVGQKLRVRRCSCMRLGICVVMCG
mmetsp:Transcript_2024/g.3246  ORF Transcript_2024/g.3246 Transcript_2024/m.3246 type:complete len:119 (-) Transcript_2024:488-844(-)